jgi:ABC-type sugar transport system ATPase subunit
MSSRLATTPFLELRGVSKHYGAVQALMDVDLDIHRGQVLGLLGDNGAGKSTLIKTIAGVVVASAGSVRCNGKEVFLSSPEIARGFGIETVFQDLALIPNLSVASNFFLGREMTMLSRNGLLGLLQRHKMEKEVIETLKKLDIHIPSVKVAVDELSGGQKQAVAIARATHWKANLVIMDEPTAALSVPEQKKVLALARQLASDGVAVIYITHNILDVVEVTDRIVVLHRGRKAAEVLTADTNEHEIISMIMGKTTRSP